eukprot:TRINITY_DN3531_c0_g1_i7.p1 TRINITY_DN3531_c0_g1~~TRINITY_DN3531_c0_g1_i7.p1  ORF type:complete len:721 (+),score=96.72 TRINITY_DN3531_c0_g1_i7:91-2163(+)
MSGKRNSNKIISRDLGQQYDTRSSYGFQNTTSKSQTDYLSRQERFRQELEQDGLRIEPITGDGSCMYHSIADQLQYLNPGKTFDYQDVKRQILEYIAQNAATYAKFVENNDLQLYLQNKERDGAWGGIIELKVAAKIFEVNVWVYSTTDPSWGLTLFEGDDVKTMLLSYHGNAHYNSLRKTRSDLTTSPTPEQPEKERRKKQFQEELRKEQLEIVHVLGSGNGLFQAVADQLQQEYPRKVIDHKTVRTDVVKHIQKNKQKYKSKVKDEDVGQYVAELSKQDANGTKVELEIVAEIFKVNIQVFCTDGPSYKIISPKKTDKWIYMSFHDSSYYNSLEKITDSLLVESDDTQQQNSSTQESNNTATQQSKAEEPRQAQQDLPEPQLQKPTTEDQQTKPNTNQQPTSQEQNYDDFRRQLARDSLEIAPYVGTGNRLFHCIADQLQQVCPESNLNYETVKNEIQQYINNHKSEFYKFSHGKMQGPMENGGFDELRSARAAFKVNVKVFYPDNMSLELALDGTLDGNNYKTIYLSCREGDIYDSLKPIISSHQLEELTEAQSPQKTEQNQTIDDTQLQVPKVQKISRSKKKKEPLNNFEMDFQEFQTCIQKRQIAVRAVTKEGSGFFHSIADQLQVNIVVFTQTTELTPFSRTDFPDKPATIYLLYSGTLFKSLRRQQGQNEDEENSGVTDMQIG